MFALMKPETNRNRELREFARVLFSLLNDCLGRDDILKVPLLKVYFDNDCDLNLSFRLTGLESALGLLAVLIKRNKLELCSRIAGLSSSECEDLTALVKCEEDLTVLKKCFEAFDSALEDGYFSNGALNILSRFFASLEHLMCTCNRILLDESQIEGSLPGYFLKLAEDIDALKEAYHEKLLAEKEWETPLGMDSDIAYNVLSYDEKLASLRKLCLMERLARCFRENGKESWKVIHCFLIDEQVKYLGA